MRLIFSVEQEYDQCKLSSYLRTKGISSSILKKAKLQNGLFVNGEGVFSNYILQAGQIAELVLREKEASFLEAEEMPFCVLYEDESVLVVNKPAGLAMHPTLNYINGTLANGYMAYMHARGEQNSVFRPIARLDRNTSGIVLLAKNAFAASRIAKSCHKQYVAIVHGELSSSDTLIEKNIDYAPNSIIQRCVVDVGGKTAITNYRVLAVCAGYTVVQVEPLTGRTHQIRVHFSSIGHPLVGDELYGGSTTELARQALHCRKVTWEDPQKSQSHSKKVFCKLPDDFAQFLKRHFLCTFEEENSFLQDDFL